MWNRFPLCWNGLGLGTHFLRTKQGNGKPVTLPWRNLADSLLALGSGGMLSRMSCWHEAPLNSPLSPQLSLIRQIQTEEHSTAYIADTLQKSWKPSQAEKTRATQWQNAMWDPETERGLYYKQTKKAQQTNKQTKKLGNLSEICSVANKNHLEQVRPSSNDQSS